jgi:hypothetical protein
MASLFIFLIEHVSMGSYRVNSKGEYNVPIGSYKVPLICDENNLRQVSEALSIVTIVCGDYRKSNDFVDSDTFVYLTRRTAHLMQLQVLRHIPKMRLRQRQQNLRNIFCNYLTEVLM